MPIELRGKISRDGGGCEEKKENDLRVLNDHLTLISLIIQYDVRLGAAVMEQLWSSSEIHEERAIRKDSVTIEKPLLMPL